jgi:hypothetical protein
MLRKQDTDRSVRPGTAISRMEQTQTTTVPAHSQNRRRGNRPSKLPEGANIGRRRAQHSSSILLTSPARPGHASRMRQIFDAAATPIPTFCRTETALYPQLPNISRAASPPTSIRRGWVAPRAAGLRTILQHAAPLSAQANSKESSTLASESSSGSGSDDSKYIVFGHARSLAEAASTAHRIEDWLSTATLDINETEETSITAETSNNSCPQASIAQDELRMASTVTHGRMTSSNWHSPIPQAVQPKSCCATHMLLHDPFVAGLSSGASSTGRSATAAEDSCRTSTSPRSQGRVSDARRKLDFESLEFATKVSPAFATSTPKAINHIFSDATNDGDGGIEWSPLSPNVCTKRGPSRYHLAYTNRLAASPTRPPMQTSFFAPLRELVDLTKGTVVADRGLVLGTRTVREPS